MLPKRLSRSDSSFTDSERHLILAAETLRAGDAPGAAKEVVRPEERISLFWRVFGGTILSICALAVLTAYQSLANGIHDLRKRVRSMANFVKIAGGDAIGAQKLMPAELLSTLDETNAKLSGIKDRGETADADAGDRLLERDFGNRERRGRAGQREDVGVVFRVG